MKTTTDIAQFLKRTGCTLSLSFDDKGGRFLAHVKGDEAASKYLDDALENLAEALRRRANDMLAMRESKTEASPVVASSPNGLLAGGSSPPKATHSTLPSISQAAQQAYQQGRVAQAACTACNGMGYVIRHVGGVSFASTCNCTPLVTP